MHTVDRYRVGECMSERMLVVWALVWSGGILKKQFCSGIDRIFGDPCWRMKTSAWSRTRLD